MYKYSSMSQKAIMEFGDEFQDDHLEDDKRLLKWSMATWEDVEDVKTQPPKLEPDGSEGEEGMRLVVRKYSGSRLKRYTVRSIK